jgi:hypothetical protein
MFQTLQTRCADARRGPCKAARQARLSPAAVPADPGSQVQRRGDEGPESRGGEAGRSRGAALQDPVSVIVVVGFVVVVDDVFLFVFVFAFVFVFWLFSSSSSSSFSLLFFFSWFFFGGGGRRSAGGGEACLFN